MYKFKRLQHNTNKNLKNFQIVGFAMHTQTWVVQLFTCHIKHNVVLEKAVARNEKLGGIS